jgi:hypothetical protein
VNSIYFSRATFFAFVNVRGNRTGGFCVKIKKAVDLRRKTGIETAGFSVNEKTDVLPVGST